MSLARSARLDAAMLAISVALPACFAAAHAANVTDAAHDEAVVRAMGLGWTGAWRALDAPWCGLFAWLPLGTRALRAALASAAACGVGGGVIFALARAVLARCADARRLGPIVAMLAALAATLSPAWQVEALAPAGSTLGAVLALAPLAILVAREPLQVARMGPAALVLGLAATYEPLAGVSALLAIVAWIAAAEPAERGAAIAHGRANLRHALAGLALGLVPLALGLTRRVSGMETTMAALASSIGERAESGAAMPLAFVRDDVGLASCGVAAAGAVIAALVPRARGAVAGLATITWVGFAAMILGAPAGPTRYGAPVLAAVGAAYAMAAVAMQAIVRLVAHAKVPFAPASAAMILVLEAAFPARAADDSGARAEQRTRGASAAWNDVAWGTLPAGALVLVHDPQVQTRLLAARAAGELRADLALVPLFDLAGPLALRELASDVKLQPLWRDAALTGAPQEWSLSSLASSRPLVAPYDPRWDRTLARHLVPSGLFARFEPEPRGGSDRRRALDDFTATRERLARAIDADPELLTLTTALLRGRAVALAATSERDVVAHAIDDLRPFSPRDPVAAELVRRMALTRGAIDVKDLVP